MELYFWQLSINSIEEIKSSDFGVSAATGGVIKVSKKNIIGYRSHSMSIKFTESQKPGVSLVLNVKLYKK